MKKLFFLLGSLLLAIGSVIVANLANKPEPANGQMSSSPLPPPSPTPDPLSIEYLRQLDYEGEPLIEEEKLSEEPGYTRYRVSFVSQGLKEYAILTIPDSPAPEGGYPAVLFAHGDIKPDEYGKGEDYIIYRAGVAEEGFVVLAPDYRGHGDSEGTAVNAYAVNDYTVDVLEALASLRNYPSVNPEKVGIWGHSTGGHIVLRALAADPQIKAAAIWGGVVGSYPELIQDYPTTWEEHQQGTLPSPNPENPKATWRSFLVNTYGDFEQNKEAWAKISATSYLDEIRAPIQLHHAKDDEWVPPRLSERLHQRLQALGKYSELYLYDNNNHDFRGNLDTVMERTVEFFRERLR